MTHACKWCGRTFLRPDHLQRHERVHVRTKLFKCAVCASRFGRRDSLLCHYSQVHDIDPAEPAPVLGDQSTSIVREPRGGCLHPRSRFQKASVGHQRPSSSASAGQHDPGTRGDGYCDLKTKAEITHTELWKDGDNSNSQTTSAISSTDHGDCFATSVMDFDSVSSLRHFLGMDAVVQFDQSFKERQFPNKPLPLMGSELPRISLSRPTVQRYLTKYKELALPAFPCLHLPSYDTEVATRDLVSGGLNSCPQHGVQQPLRHLPEFLFLHLLMFGAAYDKQPDTALELYIDSGRQLQAEIERQKLDTTNRRTVAVVQALLLRAAFGLCSGCMEFEQASMGHLCSAASLVNEMNLACTAGYPGREAPESDDTRNIQWLCWVDDEERGRTIFAALGITGSAHFILDDAPTVDINGIHLCLPCHEALWEAQSAAEWHRLLPSFTHSKVPGFLEQFEKLFTSEELPIYARQTPSESACWQNSSVATSIEPYTSEFGCLVLVCALNQLASKVYGAGIGVHYTPDEARPFSRRTLLGAVVMWQSLWETFPHGSIPPSQHRLLRGCLPYLDHIHLLLRTNISCTKKMLWEREYDQLGYGESFRAVLSGDHSIRVQLLSAATYAIDTLETTLKIIVGRHPGPLAAAIPHNVAFIMFHAVHIVCNWMLLPQDTTITWNPATCSSSSSSSHVTSDEDLVLQKYCNIISLYCASTGCDLPLDKYSGLKESSSLAIHLLRLCEALFEEMSEWGVFREMAKSFHVRAGGLEELQQHRNG